MSLTSRFTNGARERRPDALAMLERADAQPASPHVFAPPARRAERLAELEHALVPAVTAPLPPLSEAARKLVSETEIRKAEHVADTLRSAALARLVEFDHYVATRRDELLAFGHSVEQWAADYVAKVKADQEERAREHARDVDIVQNTTSLLERHGVPLPPPLPRQAQAPAESAPAAEAEPVTVEQEQPQ